MDVALDIVFVFAVYTVGILAVPPEACFATFRWDDCGQPPVPVMYYWKPGSRCEVGLWRGCLPNLNMFQDEYECVATCIFSARAGAEDYHDIYSSIEGLKDVQTTVNANYTDATNGDTDVTNTGGTGVTKSGDDTKATELASTAGTESGTSGTAEMAAAT